MVKDTCQMHAIDYAFLPNTKMNNQTIPQMLFHDVQMLKKSGVLLVLQVAKMFIKDRAQKEYISGAQPSLYKPVL